MKGQKIFFALSVVLILVAACAPAPAPTQPPAPAATQPPAAPKEVNLDFVIWTFATDMVQDNINKYQATAPGVKVKLTDYNWGQYHDTVVTNFTSGSAVPDVLYGSDHWLQEWASAGWIVPLKKVFPADQVDALTKDMSRAVC
jgi:ABC-type glycerol-3-phosphate transport system substrate-binding protein